MFMEKIVKYLGLPVICSSEIVGSIKRVYFSAAKKRIVGFYVKKRRNFSGRLLLFEDVQFFGHAGIVIQNMSCLHKIYHSGIARYMPNERLSGLKVYAYHGDFIGTVKNVYVDFQTGKIDALEVSSGFYDDIVTGTKQLPMLMKTEIGNELIIADRESLEEMRIGQRDEGV